MVPILVGVERHVRRRWPWLDRQIRRWRARFDPEAERRGDTARIQADQLAAILRELNTIVPPELRRRDDE
jgi:hypothetical protein